MSTGPNSFPIHEHLPVAEQAAVEMKVGELSTNLTTLLAQKPDYWWHGPDNRFFASFPPPGEPDKAVDLVIQTGGPDQPTAYSIGVRSRGYYDHSRPQQYAWREGDKAVNANGTPWHALADAVGLDNGGGLPATLIEMERLVSWSDPARCELDSPGKARLAARRIMRLVGIR